MDPMDIQLIQSGFANIAELSNPRMRREVVIATSLSVVAMKSIASITATVVPNGATVTVGASPITVGQTATVGAGSCSLSLDTVGSYRLVVTFDAGVRDLLLFGIEAAALTSILKSTPPLGTALTAAEQRLILRSLCAEAPSWWTGAASSLAGHALGNHGA